MASLGLLRAGDGLNVVPCSSLGLQLYTAEFGTAALYRLGLPLYLKEDICNACWSQTSDIYGDHAISCPSHGERISRHNHLQDTLYHTAVSASLGPSREDRGLIPGADGARPADLYIPLWAPGGKDAALDVCVVSPLQQATIKSAAKEPGYALLMCTNQKWS